jgi:hypothetical protein
VDKIFDFTIVLKDSERNVSLGDTIFAKFAYQVLVDTSEENTNPYISTPNGGRT